MYKWPIYTSDISEVLWSADMIYTYFFKSRNFTLSVFNQLQYQIYPLQQGRENSVREMGKLSQSLTVYNKTQGRNFNAAAVLRNQVVLDTDQETRCPEKNGISVFRNIPSNQTRHTKFFKLFLRGHFQEWNLHIS